MFQLARSVSALFQPARSVSASFQPSVSALCFSPLFQPGFRCAEFVSDYEGGLPIGYPLKAGLFHSGTKKNDKLIGAEHALERSMHCVPWDSILGRTDCVLSSSPTIPHRQQHEILIHFRDAFAEFILRMFIPRFRARRQKKKYSLTAPGFEHVSVGWFTRPGASK